MDKTTSDRIINRLYADITSADSALLDERPLLAHYTTIQTLESILKNNEVWLTNPTLSNDYNEILQFFDEFDLARPDALWHKLEERYDQFEILDNLISPIHEMISDFRKTALPITMR